MKDAKVVEEKEVKLQWKQFPSHKEEIKYKEARILWEEYANKLGEDKTVFIET